MHQFQEAVISSAAPQPFFGRRNRVTTNAVDFLHDVCINQKVRQDTSVPIFAQTIKVQIDIASVQSTRSFEGLKFPKYSHFYCDPYTGGLRSLIAISATRWSQDDNLLTDPAVGRLHQGAGGVAYRLFTLT
ncbi:hypothetical protein [Paraburkholderia strydomiana]|uniref:hypothetical protein n=1 Tax=Paraburkholderia strydomiana TaxID=1245417 RepID=UPI0038B91549